MVVLVETNFLLELAFQQEDSPHAERILTFAESKAVELVVPACALSEPHETLIRRKKNRDTIRKMLGAEIFQIARSRPYADFLKTSKSVMDVLTRSLETEEQGLRDIALRVLRCATIAPLSKSALEAAVRAEDQYELEPQDAIVFASIDEHLKSALPGEKLFVNKNYKDFQKPDIEMYLRRLNCKLLPKFSSARELIEVTVARTHSAK